MKIEAEGSVVFHIEVRLKAAEMGTWSPERIAAFFDGIAKARAAAGGEPRPSCGSTGASQIEPAVPREDRSFADSDHELPLPGDRDWDGPDE